MAAATPAAQTSKVTEIKNFTVISVDGNKAVLKEKAGPAREITVPEDFKFNVAGKQMSVHELKPGMTGQATITTTTTVKPVYVTEVRNGEVMQASGNPIIIRGPNGIKMFSQGDIEKRGITVMRAANRPSSRSSTPATSSPPPSSPKAHPKS